MTKIGLISDVHATPQPVEEALAIFRRAGVQQILCAGDIAGYRDQLGETVSLLVESGCHTVLGNHDRLYMRRDDPDIDKSALAFFADLPASMSNTMEGKRVYMVHAQPPDSCHGGIKLLDKAGKVQADRVAYWEDELKSFDHDVLVVGHTHQVFAERVGNTLVVNPGSSAFNHSCAILHLPQMHVQLYPLSGKQIKRNWNWSEHVVRKDRSKPQP